MKKFLDRKSVKSSYKKFKKALKAYYNGQGAKEEVRQWADKTYDKIVSLSEEEQSLFIEEWNEVSQWI